MNNQRKNYIENQVVLTKTKKISSRREKNIKIQTKKIYEIKNRDKIEIESFE